MKKWEEEEKKQQIECVVGKDKQYDVKKIMEIQEWKVNSSQTITMRIWNSCIQLLVLVLYLSSVVFVIFSIHILVGFFKAFLIVNENSTTQQKIKQKNRNATTFSKEYSKWMRKFLIFKMFVDEKNFISSKAICTVLCSQHMKCLLKNLAFYKYSK